ncbi:hypothetical protein L873DRAFT_1798608 [Choiromyces venosus 120613-1]|uniref:Uncharacterized protein n=1 Tax=Choiromyces venosus 120613-1 TaxID=1336337 RepID=A0A3N4K5L0_9PEZI|nr:hypothetical protein L873DRAFT_1798597 [Choiromyces venosus 120613-1]RPB04802.1 hypothetical protein L873DRAFT_1798608 [Choiromyces venosus 120613-1]
MAIARLSRQTGKICRARWVTQVTSLENPSQLDEPGRAQQRIRVSPTKRRPIGRLG